MSNQTSIETGEGRVVDGFDQSANAILLTAYAHYVGAQPLPASIAHHEKVEQKTKHTAKPVITLYVGDKNPQGFRKY